MRRTTCVCCLLAAVLLMGASEAAARQLKQATVATSTPVGVNDPSVEAQSGLSKLFKKKLPDINVVLPSKQLVEAQPKPQVLPTQTAPSQPAPSQQPITLVMPQQTAPTETLPTTTTGGITINTSTPVHLNTPIDVKTPVLQKNFQKVKGLGTSSGLGHPVDPKSFVHGLGTGLVAGGLLPNILSALPPLPLPGVVLPVGR